MIDFKVLNYRTAQKMKFSIKDFFSKCDQIPTDLVTFTEEIHSGKLLFRAVSRFSQFLQTSLLIYGNPHLESRSSFILMNTRFTVSIASKLETEYWLSRKAESVRPKIIKQEKLFLPEFSALIVYIF